MVVVVIPLTVTETSLTMLFALDEAPLSDPPPDLVAEVVCEDPDWEDAPDWDAVVDWDDDAAAVLDEPMAEEIDMESPPERDIGEAAPVRDLPAPSTQFTGETGGAISV
jgi:hypothetical protein